MRTRITPALKPLDRITPDDRPRAGGKAYNCARLKQAGFPVPDGLVLLAAETNADLAEIAGHAWFDGSPPGALFAVRSSAIGEDGDGESFAGIHQTVLNVGRDNLTAAIAACRASARSPQAIEYRRAKRLSTDAGEMAVLIQRMIQPVAAGVAFTVNPVTGAESELVINASWGLGEALVSGQIDPDEFVVAKQDGELRWSRVGEKANSAQTATPSLTPGQIRELAAILTEIERHYGAPQDVEWCHDGAGFWVVQSRPITTTRARVDETEWTRANLAEVLPDLTSPQALASFEDLLNRAERLYLGKLMAPEDKLGPMVKTFAGRLHFNLSQLRHVCALGGVAPAWMLKSMGHAGAIQASDEVPQPAAIGARLSCLPDMLRILWQHLRAAHVVRAHSARIREHLRFLAAEDPHRLADRELWAVVEQWVVESPEFMQVVFLLSNVLFHEGPVRKICERVGFPFEHLVYPQLATGERSVSAQQAFDLVALAETARHEPAVVQYFSAAASGQPSLGSNTLPSFGLARMTDVRAALRETRFLAAFDRFLETYGHRGRYETDWSLPKYNEDPTPLLQAIRTHLESDAASDAGATAARQAREAADGWTAFEQRLSWWQKWTALPRVKRSIRHIKQYYVWREQVRFELMRVVAVLRAWHLVMADRFVDRGWLDSQDDYFQLELGEVGAIVRGHASPDTLRAIVAVRLAERERNRSIQMPLLMRASELPALIRMASVSGGAAGERELTGYAVSGGCVEAEVVVVRDPGDFARMKRGAILVAPATDPSWTPLFTLAAGVIVEVGGVLSHASTIAREFGLPALANVKDATRRLRTGERVRLDANRGVVQKLDL